MNISKKPDSGSVSWVIVSVLALTWGSSFILMKKALQVYSSDEVGALRIVISFVFLLPFALNRASKMSSRDTALVALSGLIGNGIPAFLFATAQTVISSYMAGILNALTPLFTIIMGLMLFGIRPRWFNVMGVFMGLAGAVGLLVATSDGNLTFQLGYGGLIVLATLLYATNTNLIKVRLHHIDPVAIVSVAFLFLGPPIATYLLMATDFVSQLSTDPHALKGLMYLAILSIGGTALALMLYNKLLKATTALFASSITYLMPVIALMWGIVDGEKFSSHFVIYIALILLGMLLVSSKHAETLPLIGFLIRKIKILKPSL